MARRVSLCGHDHHRDRRRAPLFFFRYPLGTLPWGVDMRELNESILIFHFSLAHIPITHTFARLTRLDLFFFF